MRAAAKLHAEGGGFVPESADAISSTVEEYSHLSNMHATLERTTYQMRLSSLRFDDDKTSSENQCKHSTLENDMIGHQTARTLNPCPNLVVKRFRVHFFVSIFVFCETAALTVCADASWLESWPHR